MNSTAEVLRAIHYICKDHKRCYDCPLDEEFCRFTPEGWDNGLIKLVADIIDDYMERLKMNKRQEEMIGYEQADDIVVLKPCPICGNTEIEITSEGDSDYKWSIIHRILKTKPLK